MSEVTRLQAVGSGATPASAGDRARTGHSVPFVDLDRLHSPLAGELSEAIARVIADSDYVLGAAVEAFEQRFASYVGRRHCVATSSGTAALHLALLAAGVGPGDHVVTTPHTWISTAWAISYCGARPVFADVDPETGNLDVGTAERALTSRTRAVVPVDLYGNPAALPAFEALGREHGISVVDDACQAHGSRLGGRLVGGFGDLSCFSFYPAKNLGGFGEGGAVLTDDGQTAARLRQLRDHGQSRRHRHEEIGFNYRMDGIQGAVLGVKLAYLDAWNASRRAAAHRYAALLGGLPGLRVPTATPGSEPNWHLYVVQVGARARVLHALNSAGIGAGVHYPTPIHRQPAYRSLGLAEGSFPVAEGLAASCLSLPIYPSISAEQQALVSSVLAQALAL